MNHFGSQIRRSAVLLVFALAILAAGLIGQTPTQAQTTAPTRTPTRDPRAIARLLLKGISTKSPDGAGSGITAQVQLPSDGAFWQGKVFEFQKLDGPDVSVEFTVLKIEPNGGRIEVYRHTEQNIPWCPFGNGGNNVCNPLPQVNGTFRWPDSDNLPGSGKPVQPGNYVMEVIATGKDGGSSWRKREGEDNAIYFTIELQDETPLPPLTGRAEIRQPANGQVWRGVVTIRGTAFSNNFAYYKFELLDSRCDNGVCFLREFRQPVRNTNAILWRWNTRQPLPNGTVLPNGNWVMRLVVVDIFARSLPNTPLITFTLQN
jgi:hypothetical protein